MLLRQASILGSSQRGVADVHHNGKLPTEDGAADIVGPPMAGHPEGSPQTFGTAREVKRIAVSIPEAAEQLSVSESTIKREITRGRLRFSKVGRRVVIRVTEIEDYLDRNSGVVA